MSVAEDHKSPEDGQEPDQEAGQDAPEPGKAPAPRRRRRVHAVARHGLRFFLLWTLASIGFVLAFSTLVGIALLDRPVELPGWVTSRVEAELNRGLPAGRISLDHVDLEITRGSAPRIQLRNVQLFDGSGLAIAQLNQVGARFDVARLIEGDFLPDRLRLSGAQVTIRRRQDGSFDLSFGQTAQASGSLADILRGLDNIFAEGPLSRIATIEATDLTVSLEDARTARIWQVTEGRTVFTQTDRDIAIEVAFDVFNGTEEMATTSFRLHSDKATAAADIEASFSNAASGDIALQSPVLAFLGVLDAPIAGSVDVSFDADAALSDFSGSLTIGGGWLSPGEGVDPIRIRGGRALFTYDPDRQRLDFSDLGIESEALQVSLSGQTLLRDLGPDGWPRAFVGQYKLVNLMLRDDTMLSEPLEFHDGLAEMRLQLRPFRFEIGKLRLRAGDATLRASGRAVATEDGPEIAVDASADRLTVDRLMALWPPGLTPLTRDWLQTNIHSGTATDAHLAVRRAPGQERPDLLVGLNFEDAAVTFMETMPPVEHARGYVSIARDRLVVKASAGQVTAPEGGALELAGTVFTVPDTSIPEGPAEVDLKAKGPLTAMLSLLDQEPLKVMERAGQPIDVATGEGEIAATIKLNLRPGNTLDDIDLAASGTLTQGRSDKIVPGRTITADRLQVAVDNSHVEVTGPAVFGKVPVDVTWSQGIGAKADQPGTVTGSIRLDQTFLTEFGIALPDGAFSGTGQGQIDISLPQGKPPSFRLTSGLSGITLRLDPVMWRKSARQKGSLVVEGTLGARPTIDRLALEGGGLNAEGKVTLKADGSLDRAAFSRVRLNGWLDAPVTLVGRGAAQPEIDVNGGTLDFRKAAFGSAGGAGGGSGPINVRLDRLQVADSIALTGFNGEFSTRGGFSGTFTGRLNGGGVVNGTAAPQNGGTGVRVTSQNAGDVLKDANVAQRVRGGAMDLILSPTGQEGVYNGQFQASDVRVRGTPALAELMNAVSVVGLLQQLNGDGIVFDSVEARFVLTPNAINFTRASAVGASLGISAEGAYMLATGGLDIRGVFSPVYLVNGIGQIFGRKGEGLFGVNYRVQGTSEDPRVSVNPLSILTPGMFREIFRAPPPKVR